MDEVKHVLLITNSTTPAEVNLVKHCINKANHRNLKIKLSLLHVVPDLPAGYLNMPSMVTLAEQNQNEAKNCLQALGEHMHVVTDDQWLASGRLKTVAFRLANQLKVDFILASRDNIQDLHRSFLFRRNRRPLIKPIGNIAQL